MDPKLSANMPAQMDATLPAKMSDSMPSDTQPTGDGGSDDGPVVEIVRDSAPSDAEWMSVNDMHGEKWQTSDQKTGSEWEATDRKEGDTGGLPQSDPDGDGDLN